DPGDLLLAFSHFRVATPSTVETYLSVGPVELDFRLRFLLHERIPVLKILQRFDVSENGFSRAIDQDFALVFDGLLTKRNHVSKLRIPQKKPTPDQNADHD